MTNIIEQNKHLIESYFNEVWNIEYMRDGKVSQHWRIIEEFKMLKQLEVI